MNAWFALVVAGMLEIAWAVGLKHTEGLTKPLPTFFTLVALGASFWLLARAVGDLPVGTAYAVWVGIGAAGTALFGMFVLGEPISAQRLGWIALLLVAVVGLKSS